MTDLWIAGARHFDGSVGDLFISGGVFVDHCPSGAQKIDADGLVALPGFVDLHTHLREPAPDPAETIRSGTAAAAAGGYTAVLAMANTEPVTDCVEVVEQVQSLAVEAATEVIAGAAITKGLEGKELTDIAALAAAGVRLISDDGKCVMNAQLMRQAMELAAEHDLIVAQHSQDHELAPAEACADERSIAAELGVRGWPWTAESAIIARDAQLAELTGAHLHVCHVSTAESLEVVRWAKARGINITAEATPHHLLLTSDRLRGLDTSFKVNPPLRSDEDVQALRQAVADGTVDVIGTDHAPHRLVDKQQPFPQAKPGMIALEQALAVVLETLLNPGLIDWPRVAQIMSIGPARLARVPDQGGKLAPGERANLTLVDPARRVVVDREKSKSLGRNNPYHGIELPDPVQLTIRAGEITFNHA